MDKEIDTGGISPDLLQWVSETLGGEVTQCERIVGGASRLSYQLSLAPSARVAEAFLRVDSGTGPLAGTLFTLEREIATMLALKGTAVRLPEIYAFNPQHRAVLMQKVRGTSDFLSVNDPDRAVDLQNDLLQQLALLHQAQLDLRQAFGTEAPATVKEALQAEVKLWGDLYQQHVVDPEPAISFALDWLLRSAPGTDQPAVLVHGDIGPGNFMFEGRSVQALIDWEITHAGHPLEDLACIIARTLGIPFGDLRQHVITYGRLTGATVDYKELDYCVVLVLTKFCIGISMGIAKASLAVDIAILVKFLQVNLFALVKILTRFAGMEATSPPTVQWTVGPTHALYDVAAEVLAAQIKPVINEHYLLARLDGLNGLLFYLRNLADYGTDRLRAQELTALQGVLRRQVATVQEGRVLLADALARSSAEERATIVGWLLQRCAQEHLLMKEMLGPMYERTLVY